VVEVEFGKNMKNISVDIITSAYNEEECLPELFKRIEKVMENQAGYDYRIIVIDNGSHDRTWEIIENQTKFGHNTKGIRMSRNFTLDAAFTCGLDLADADLAIIMTSDLQDPPEAIPELLAKWEEGFDQVLVKIRSRDSVPVVRRILSKLFYKLARKMTEGMLPESVSDFRLVNRKTYLAIRSLRESHRFLRGLGSWVGFTTSTIELDRPPRFAGESKWLGISLFGVIAMASRSVLAYSAIPLLWISAMGFILSIFSLFGIIIMSLLWIFGSVPFAGFGTIVGLITLGFSLTMLAIGVLAQYLGLVYEEVKQRPLYLIANSIPDDANPIGK
jgi:dolichol-phosphate mannosyltransferase